MVNIATKGYFGGPFLFQGVQGPPYYMDSSVQMIREIKVISIKEEDIEQIIDVKVSAISEGEEEL